MDEATVKQRIAACLVPSVGAESLLFLRHGKTNKAADASLNADWYAAMP